MVATVTPRPLPAAGPNTNDPFEELRQHPQSEYSFSMVYTVAMMALSSQPARGDSLFWNEEEKRWKLYRSQPGQYEQQVIIQLVQVTHGGSIQFRYLDLSSGLGWRSAYLPTAALMKNKRRAK